MDSRRLSLTATLLAAAAILVATLVPNHSVPIEDLNRIGSGPWDLADFLRNVILFAPLGASLAWRGDRARHAILACAVLSALIELAQIAIPGRDPNPTDVIANVIGAALGVVLVETAPAWLRPSASLERALAIAAGTVAAATFTGTGILLAPAPSTATFFGQHPSEVPHLARFAGVVLDASLDDIEIPIGRFENSSSVQTRLRGDYRLRVRALGDAPPPD